MRRVQNSTWRIFDFPTQYNGALYQKKFTEKQTTVLSVVKCCAIMHIVELKWRLLCLLLKK